MGYWRGSDEVLFSWTQVIAAFWHRYPNPCSQHVLTEDVLDRYVIDGKLFTKRIITKKGKVPKFAEKFTNGVTDGYVIEESVLDLQTQTLTTYTRNINMCNVLLMHEKCVYQPAAYSTDSTTITRQAWSSSAITGFGSILSMYGIKQYEKNLEKTKPGFVYVLKTLFDPDSLPQSFGDSKRTARQFSYLIWILRKIHFKLKQLIFQHLPMKLMLPNCQKECMQENQNSCDTL